MLKRLFLPLLFFLMGLFLAKPVMASNLHIHSLKTVNVDCGGQSQSLTDFESEDDFRQKNNNSVLGSTALNVSYLLHTNHFTKLHSSIPKVVFYKNTLAFLSIFRI